MGAALHLARARDLDHGPGDVAAAWHGGHAVHLDRVAQSAAHGLFDGAGVGASTVTSSDVTSTTVPDGVPPSCCFTVTSVPGVSASTSVLRSQAELRPTATAIRKMG